MSLEESPVEQQPRRRDRRIITGAVLGMVAVIVALWFISDARNDRAIRAEHDQVVAEREARIAAEQEVQALEGLQAATAALKDQCRKGIESACHQLVGLETLPDAGEQQDAEVQEAEIQEPEIQEGERDDAERQDPELDDPDSDDPEQQDDEVDQPEEQDAETDDPEVDDPDANDPDVDDPEKQDDEQQDPEVDDPEIQDDEVQDPEHDDPDPNSMLRFAAVDNCAPPAGEVVVDVDLTMLRDPDAGSVTYVLSCTSAPISSLINLPGNDR